MSKPSPASAGKVRQPIGAELIIIILVHPDKSLVLAGEGGGAGCGGSRGNSRPILPEVLTDCTSLPEDLFVLDQGRFRWDVEAQCADEAGAVIQGGNRREDSFTVDIPLPGSARTSGIGEIYGVESRSPRGGEARQ